MKNKLSVSVILVAILVLGTYFVLNREKETMIIGGERSEEGCLVAGGYAYNEEIGACVRGFELTPDIARAAKMAVYEIGRGYALTLVSFNSYEEYGAYDLTFEIGREREEKTIYIRNWEITPKESLE